MQSDRPSTSLPGPSTRAGEQSPGGRYRLFNRCLSSQIPLPELPPMLGGAPAISVLFGAGVEPDEDTFTRCHDWRTAEGRLICRSARRGEEYLLALPGQARFLIEPGGQVHCFPVKELEPRLLRQLLLNQVLPRYLAHKGELLLHASAVRFANGITVAFVGESGRGKSTLASYCHSRGAQLIDDDCILLGFEHGKPRITGGVPTIRLYPDSLTALGHNPDDFEACAESSDKRQMCLHENTPSKLEPPELDDLFLLAPPNARHTGRATVQIEPATGSAATMALMGSAFSLNPSDPDTMARIFSQVGRILTQAHGLRVNHLYYPRTHASLPQVLEALHAYPGV